MVIGDGDGDGDDGVYCTVEIHVFDWWYERPTCLYSFPVLVIVWIWHILRREEWNESWERKGESSLFFSLKIFKMVRWYFRHCCSDAKTMFKFMLSNWRCTKYLQVTYPILIPSSFDILVSPCRVWKVSVRIWYWYCCIHACMDILTCAAYSPCHLHPWDICRKAPVTREVCSFRSVYLRTALDKKEEGKKNSPSIWCYVRCA